MMDIRDMCAQKSERGRKWHVVGFVEGGETGLSLCGVTLWDRDILDDLRSHPEAEWCKRCVRIAPTREDQSRYVE